MTEKTDLIVDAERKAMRDRLDALKAEVRRPLDEWEQEEVDRVESIRKRLSCFGMASHPDWNVSQIVYAIDAIESVSIDKSFAEFQAEAQLAKEGCLYRLTVARDAALHREAEAARIAAEAEAASAKREAAKRTADQAHRERIHAEIVEDLGFPPESCLGDNLVIDISEGRIRHLRIIY